MRADLQGGAKEFFCVWPELNRGEWKSIFIDDGCPTVQAIFACKHGHPWLEEFVSDMRDADAGAHFVNAVVQDGNPPHETTLARIAVRSAEIDNDHHYDLVMAMVKVGAIDDKGLTHDQGALLTLAKGSQNEKLRCWANSYGKFLGRYELIGLAVHCSATCLVIYAYDIEPQKPKPVALKFMHNRDEYQREIQMRLLDRYRTQ